MKNLARVLVPLCATLAASPAIAYIGPGAGLSLLGALWGLVVAIAVTVGFIVLWPLRSMMKKGHVADVPDSPPAENKAAAPDDRRT